MVELFLGAFLPGTDHTIGSAWTGALDYGVICGVWHRNLFWGAGIKFLYGAFPYNVSLCPVAWNYLVMIKELCKPQGR